MIQRPQTLFLFILVLLGVALLFVSIGEVKSATTNESIYLIPFANEEISSTAGHMTAVALNFAGLILTFINVFLYKRRVLQKKLCYGLMALWVVLALMMALCPFVAQTNGILSVKMSAVGPVIAALGAASSLLAARYIQKDIDLLRSADRIR